MFFHFEKIPKNFVSTPILTLDTLMLIEHPNIVVDPTKTDLLCWTESFGTGIAISRSIHQGTTDHLLRHCNHVVCCFLLFGDIKNKM